MDPEQKRIRPLPYRSPLLPRGSTHLDRWPSLRDPNLRPDLRRSFYDHSRALRNLTYSRSRKRGRTLTAQDLAKYQAEIEEAEREEKQKSKSLVAPVKSSPKKAGGRGSPTSDPGPPVAMQPTKNRVPSNVPTTLEGALKLDGGEGKGVHETLGILVNTHMKEAEAIMGRTNVLDHEDVVAVADIFHLARNGIGGLYKEPQ